jgi:hypothetical protein
MSIHISPGSNNRARDSVSLIAGHFLRQLISGIAIQAKSGHSGKKSY